MSIQQKQKSVALHDFAMSPAPDVPRSRFNLSHGRKVPFNFSDLVPIFCEFALPGDTWQCNFNMAARTAVPIVPVQDNWRITFFTFFIPMRLVWTNAAKFWGEQNNPGDSINYIIPVTTSPLGGYAVGSLYDYFGLPNVGQVNAAQTVTHSCLPIRCYTLVYDEWFRDENLQNKVSPAFGDGPDASNYPLQQRGKRFDYYTQALPWPQKGSAAITLPIGTSATVRTNATALVTGAASPVLYNRAAAGATPAGYAGFGVGATANQMGDGTSATGGAFAFQNAVYPSNLFADLSTATGTTLNAFRSAVAMQQYLERDARMGTRYTEFVWGHFRVRTQDARLNRPEMIGSGGGQINTTAIPQTSATGITGGSTPAGSLAASGHGQARGNFVYSATEHGYILTLACATIDLTYQQGLRRMWSASTRYDFPVPLLANLGEQAILNKEIFCDGTSTDPLVFGYAPRYDEYRSIPSQIVGIYRDTAAGNISYWQSAQKFANVPVLGTTFITDAAKTVVQKNFAAGAATLGQQILADFYFECYATRALPLYGIPGLTRI